MLSILAMAILGTSAGSATLVSPPGFSASEPQVASWDNQVCVACGAGDRVYVMSSEDGGRHFGLPVRLPTHGRLDLGMRRGPRMAVTCKTIVVSAVYGGQGGGHDGDLLTWRSHDLGRTWAGPVAVNDVSGSAREGLDAIASPASGDPNIACAWLDLRNGGTQIWASTSTDGGAGWSKNVLVYSSPDGHVCECCHPSIAFGRNGQIYVMFRNWLGGSRDMYLATSSDGGQSFGAAVKLGSGTWPLNACPMDGGAIAVSPDGAVTTAWRRMESVFVCQPGRPEVVVGKGTQPWAAASDTNVAVIWQNQGALYATAFNHGSLPAEQDQLGQGGNPAIARVRNSFFSVWADSAGGIWSRIIENSVAQTVNK